MRFQKIVVFVILVAMAGTIVPAWYFMFYRQSDIEPEQNNPEDSFIGSSHYKNLSGKGLTVFPKDILGEKNLEELDISDNRLAGALPAEIRGLVSLRVLRAGNNQMTGIPAEIGQLSDLEVLDFSFNNLTGLPREIANLKKLRVLNLQGNTPSVQDLDIIRTALPGLNIIL